jgi:hypothetical protein
MHLLNTQSSSQIYPSKIRMAEPISVLGFRARYAVELETHRIISLNNKMLNFSSVPFAPSRSRSQFLLIATDQRDSVPRTCQSTTFESRNVSSIPRVISEPIVKLLLVRGLVSGSLRRSHELTTFVIRTVIDGGYVAGV